MTSNFKGHSASRSWNWCRYTWAVTHLWELAKKYPTYKVPYSKVKVMIHDLMGSDCWGKEPLIPSMLLEHADRLEKADLSYPIILIDNYTGELEMNLKHPMVLDGMHRICKIYEKGEKDEDLEVKMVFIPQKVLMEKGNYIGKEDIFCDVCDCSPCDCHWGCQ